ncbi:TRAP transporter small permease [Marivibrio halodurans]|uniref:TRAP transporter small permease protein n=1 Tax=Marivibrio halodurans TaxID=2039722 RepID=A0A8J7V163_9PROT|nr:TRAP transporter small permease [Marivibrio halodurans]MBP5857476.1 TRAP transporter small permease [Marivibrio halodurans]
MKADRAAELIAKGCAFAGLLCFLSLAGMTVLDVLMRWLFNAPIDAVSEFGGLITAVSVSATVPMALWGKRGVAVRVLGKAFRHKGRLALELFSHVATLAVLSGIVWQLVRYARQQAEMNSATWLSHWPTAPFWWVVAVILALAVLVELLVVSETLRTAKDGRDSAGADSATEF